jgi:hypothetical protein
VENTATRLFQNVKGGLLDLPYLIVTQGAEKHRFVFNKG